MHVYIHEDFSGGLGTNAVPLCLEAIMYMYIGTSLIQTPLGEKKGSLFVRHPSAGGVMSTNRVFGTAKCVLFIKVFSF